MISGSSSFTFLLQTLGLMQGMGKPTHGILSPLVSLNEKEPSSPQSHPLRTPLPNLRVEYQSGDCSVEPYQSADCARPVFAPFDSMQATVYRYRQQQSVNLGSWFVHEQWMTPSLFVCASGHQISELDIASGWGSPQSARTLLERHWDTFINASDFRYLASVGINTVRLPIGYWTLGPAFCTGTPFEPVSSVYNDSWVRVERAIEMAADVGIGVLVDLHGAPGSQNGQQHSGISDSQTQLFGNDCYVNKTMTALSFLVEKLANVTNVVGIQILNEPQNVPDLPAFYDHAISTVRSLGPLAQTLPLYIHDGFNLHQYSAYVGNRTDFVVQDTHSYFVFTPQDQAEPASQHTGDVRGSVSESLFNASTQARRNLIVGEFSCALTDQSLKLETNPDSARHEFCTGQRDIYQNHTAGWSFWAYKKEQCTDDPGWCFQAAVGRSLPSTFFSYGTAPVSDPSTIPALKDMAADMHALSGNSPDMRRADAPTPSLVDAGDAIGVFPAVQRRSRLSLNPGTERRDTSSAGGPLDLRVRDSDATQSRLPLDADQRAVAKGYSDGFLTAKIFALYGMSKLGFTGQYIRDSIAMLGPTVIPPCTEHYYEEWFMEGLRDGEALVASYVK